MKNEIAAEVASILAFAAIKNNDKIGLIIFTDQIEHYLPPKKGKGHIWNIIRTILSFKPKGKATNLSLPLEYLLKIQKKKATAFLISDFQDENYESQLKLANQRFDLIAINIIDPGITVDTSSKVNLSRILIYSIFINDSFKRYFFTA